MITLRKVVPPDYYVSVIFNVAGNGNYSFTLLDISGKQVIETYPGNKTTGNHNYTIDTKNLKPGIYFLKLESGNNSVVEKLVIRH